MSTIEKINSTENPTFPHILSHATKVPGLIFLSGQTPVGKDGKVVGGGIKVWASLEWISVLRRVNGIKQEHTVGRPEHVQFNLINWLQAQCINNLGNVLQAAGSSWEQVVKVSQSSSQFILQKWNVLQVNVYLQNMDDFAEMNSVYEKSK